MAPNLSLQKKVRKCRNVSLNSIITNPAYRRHRIILHRRIEAPIPKFSFFFFLFLHLSHVTCPVSCFTCHQYIVFGRERHLDSKYNIVLCHEKHLDSN